MDQHYWNSFLIMSDVDEVLCGSSSSSTGYFDLRYFSLQKAFLISYFLKNESFLYLSFCTKLHQQVGDRVRDKEWGWGTWPSLAAGPQISKSQLHCGYGPVLQWGAR